ncbi:MAG: HmuY family protein [Bacteroidales bacterium]|jgi:hypothetical protein|nr:HmuY family protein [Bacteroidales bacterium]MCK9448214.1 HmuY family protein [Bacteroidales bacterium]MDD3700526.1 HmuY family protein [Bacteroidales bacterium]MDY0370488.1 HmuY family protein [Bacteroidales bacterium]
MLTRALLLMFASVALLSACTKDDEGEKPIEGVKDIQFINARSYTDWVYFSFSKGETVEINDFQNSLEWDIAFHRGDIRTNGGASGIGQAEALNTQQKSWDAITEAPLSGYKKDEIGMITIEFTGEGIVEEEQPYSQVLSTWLEIDTSNPPPRYVLSNWIYVVKTAEGSYVKIQLYDNKNEKDEAGYVSFTYQYL